MSFAVITDSTCDLGKELREQYHIDYAPMNYVIDEVEYVASLDWESHSSKEYYDLMRAGTIVRTTQVPADVYTKKFTEYLEQGLDVLYISCSSALSGSINTSIIVAQQLAEQYPDRKIRCIDSLISSLGQGYLVMLAAKMREEGRSVNEVADHIEGMRLTVNQFGTTDTLEYLRRAGRVKASKAFFGNLFGVKPIIISDTKGQNFAVKKVKGSLNAKKAIAADLAAAAIHPEEQILYISHADCEADALILRDEAMKAAPFKECYINCIGPIVGASVGPGTIISFCVGEEVTIEGGE